MTLKRNDIGSFGFQLRPHGMVFDVDTYSSAWENGWRSRRSMFRPLRSFFPSKSIRHHSPSPLNRGESHRRAVLPQLKRLSLQPVNPINPMHPMHHYRASQVQSYRRHVRSNHCDALRGPNPGVPRHLLQRYHRYRHCRPRRRHASSVSGPRYAGRSAPPPPPPPVGLTRFPFYTLDVDPQ